MFRKQVYFLFIICVAVTSRQTFGWGEIGHGAVGELAERNLTPEAQNLVYQILGLEPLAISGAWPDKVRSDPRFDHFGPYHYIEIPEGKKYSELLSDQVAKKSLHTIISMVPGKLIDKKVSQAEKAILLRYLVHAVGDVHMPLHVGNGLDRGANLCLVKWKDPITKREVISNLHTLWDEGIFEFSEAEFRKSEKSFPGSKKWYGYQEFLAQTLDEKSPIHLKSLPLLDEAGRASLLTWYAEAQALHPDVYPDKGLKITADKRPYCKSVDPKTLKVVDGNFRSSKIPKIDDAYMRRALPVAQRQVVLAGLRLAALLNATAKTGKIKPIKKSTLKRLTEATAIELPAGR